VHSAAQRGAGLTRQLLAFARRQPLKPLVIDIARQVEQTASLLRSSLGSSIEVSHTAEGDGLRAGVDPSQLDLVLLMSVNPGFGGQAFIPSVLPKIEETRRRITATGKDIWLEVDGGIKAENIAQVARAGADTFVAGSAIFGARDYAPTIHAMRDQLAVL
jgi:hypothetical protein